MMNKRPFIPVVKPSSMSLKDWVRLHLAIIRNILRRAARHGR
jgi:hypothetical protein